MCWSRYGSGHGFILLNNPDLISVTAILYKLCQRYGDIRYKAAIKPIRLRLQDAVKLNDGTEDWRKEFFYEHPIFWVSGYSDIRERGITRNIDIPGLEGVIGSDYKYIRYFREPGDYFYEELFDRKNDPSDLSNLAGESEFSDLKVLLAEKTEDYIENLK